MRNRTYGGVRGRKTKVGEKLLRFPPTRFSPATGFAPSALSYTNTISRAENKLSSFTGKEIGLHFFLTKDEQQMDIVIEMLNDADEVLYTRTLSDLTFHRHSTTCATGTFFTASVTTTFDFDMKDDTTIDVPLNP